MQISLLNERITFQRNVILTDHIGNHMSSWNDEFSATIRAVGMMSSPVMQRWAEKAAEAAKKRLWQGQRWKMRIVPLPCVGADRRRM